MLIETITALMNLLNSINDNLNEICHVEVLTSEKYRENIALDERSDSSRIKYPIIVVYDNDIEYDTIRFYNDNFETTPYIVTNRDGIEVWKRDIRYPLLPYNLNYRIDIICNKRLHLDMIITWIVQNIPDRGCLDVLYKNENGDQCIYESLFKRGHIIKSDESTSVLYRRTFELKLTTLLDNKLKESVTLATVLDIKRKE